MRRAARRSTCESRREASAGSRCLCPRRTDVSLVRGRPAVARSRPDRRDENRKSFSGSVTSVGTSPATSGTISSFPEIARVALPTRYAAEKTAFASLSYLRSAFAPHSAPFLSTSLGSSPGRLRGHGDWNCCRRRYRTQLGTPTAFPAVRRQADRSSHLHSRSERPRGDLGRCGVSVRAQSGDGRPVGKSSSRLTLTETSAHGYGEGTARRTGSMRRPIQEATSLGWRFFFAAGTSAVSARPVASRL